MTTRVAAVVPSLGRAPGLDEMLARLRRELAAVDGELVWVHQGGAPAPGLSGVRERRIELPRRVGFASAVNRGIAATDAEWIAIVNDDLWLEPGWLSALLAAGSAAVDVAALQGVNRSLDDPRRVDGAGIAWNRRWQAIQIAHGEPATPRAATSPEEVFGVSATAALYRRRALAAVALAGEEWFDQRLDSWYEDVELAVRLAAAGWRALVVPQAEALHRGSATGETLSFARRRLLTRNRLLVTARLLGRRWWPALPAIVAADLGELAAALGSGRFADVTAIASGWLGAAARLPGYAHLSAPRLAPQRVGSAR